MRLRLFTSTVFVWREYYISVCHWASLPKSEFNDITLVAWSLTWWEYLHHCCKSGFLLLNPLKAVAKSLPAQRYAMQRENPAIPSTVSERQSPTCCYQYKFRVLHFSGALSAALTPYYVSLVSFLLHAPDFSFSYFLHFPPTSNTPPPSSFLLKDNLNSYFTEKTEAIQEVLV